MFIKKPACFAFFRSVGKVSWFACLHTSFEHKSQVLKKIFENSKFSSMWRKNLRSKSQNLKLTKKKYSISVGFLQKKRHLNK